MCKKKKKKKKKKPKRNSINKHTYMEVTATNVVSLVKMAEIKTVYQVSYKKNGPCQAKTCTVFGHTRTAKRRSTCTSAQSDQGLRNPLTESVCVTVECIN